MTQITYTDDASFDIDAPTEAIADEAFDVNLTINGYLTATEEFKALEANKKYYGLLEMGSTAELKRNIGSTLIELTSFENEEINLAPEVVGSISDVDTQLTDSGSVALNVDISGVFSDPESDELTYSVSGIDGLTVSDEMISGTLTEVGSFEVTVTASDGANQASTSFAVNVEAAPAEVTPPTVTPPTSSPSSGGGSLGYFVLLFLSLASYRLRKTK